MTDPEQRTPEGREMQFAVNHLGDKITVNALNPGRIRDTGLGRHRTPPPASFNPSGSTGVSEKNIAQGAATQTLLAASPLVEGVTGKYFEDCQEAVPFTPGVRRGVTGYALDPASAPPAGRLSRADGSRRMTGEPSPTRKRRSWH